MPESEELDLVAAYTAVVVADWVRFPALCSCP